MQIEVPAEIVMRLSALVNVLPSNEKREWLRSLFFEVRAGHLYAGATNALFAAIEYVGVTPSPDGFVVISRDTFPLFEPETVFNISEWSEMNWCGVSANNGYTAPNDSAIRNPDVIATLRNWRTWFPDALSERATRPMFLDVDGMKSLVKSSPSGRVVFPLIVDAERPVVVRDTMSERWVGVFFARPNNGLFLKGAQIPEWVK